ncbi:RNA polymerase sigma factor [Dactylosporangium sp. CA-092794]|uniref:RNA polymerase sigma factor n=1 Tax=Dactylosporangium sp. CA-092794 TaxID=3239929 RepID=UPI003D8B6249
MLVKRSSMLPENGTAPVWERLEAEVSGLSDLASAVAAFGSKVPPAAATVRRWQELPTLALVALAQAGHREALDPLYRRYAPVVLRYTQRRMLRLFNTVEGADDAALQVWVKVLASIDGYEPRTSDGDPFRMWLCGLAKFACWNVRAHHASETPVDAESPMWDQVAEPSQDDTQHTDPAGKTAMTASLHAAVEGLSPRQREVVRLRLDGLTAAEVAERAGLSADEAANAWETAQRTLRLRLTQAETVPFEELARTDPAQARALAEALTGVSRTIALMRLDGFGTAEIQRQTGRTGQQVGSLWFRAKAAMRRMQLDPAASKRPADASQLRAVLDDLPETTRRVVRLRLDGLTVRQVAEQIGRSERFVYTAWQRAREQAEGRPVAA